MSPDTYKKYRVKPRRKEEISSRSPSIIHYSRDCWTQHKWIHSRDDLGQLPSINDPVNIAWMNGFVDRSRWHIMPFATTTFLIFFPSQNDNCIYGWLHMQLSVVLLVILDFFPFDRSCCSSNLLTICQLWIFAPKWYLAELC